MKKNSKKGFTLVELLATITIIGILAVVSIVAVNKLIDRSKKEQREHQKEILSLAAESYMQANRGQLPRQIGETTTIYASTLKANKYLTEDIKDANKKSCMTNSFVIVYKVSKTKYKYQAHLYCGSETVPASEIKVKPTIKIEFLDKDGNTLVNDSSILNKVGEARYKITIKGGTKNGTTLELDGYSYSILAGATASTKKEVYSSGTLSANRKKEIVIDENNNLVDYVDVTGKTIIDIKVNARNVNGGVSDVTITLGGGYEESSSGTTYQDKNKPNCGTQSPQVTEWINKNSSVKERKISVPCTDVGESGCVRDTYTKTWPNSSETAAETGIITIKDNAGNSRDCTVDVKVDLSSPVITLDAYKRKSDGGKEGTSVFNGATTTTSGTTNDQVTVTADKYKNLVSNYMNNSNYPYGVVYEVTITDNLALSSLSWSTNAKNLKTNASNFSTVSLNNDDAYNNTTTCLGKKTCTILIGFLREGQRYGELVVKDKAGNTAKYMIYANLDRTAPSVPTVTYKLDGTNTAYTQGNWATKAVQSYLSGGNTDALSGWKNYQYSFNLQNGSGPTWANATTGSYTTTTGYKITPDGDHKLKYRSCDNANNCSSYSTEHRIKIDTSAPTCSVKKTNLTSDGTTLGGWYNKIIGALSTDPENGARVSRSCTETGTYGSGCKTSSTGYHDYTTNINTTTAGSAGNNVGGSVQDNAGNKTDCPANQTVKIDKNLPTCGTPVGATSVWVNHSVTVTIACSDTGGSGCAQSSYQKTFTTEGAARWSSGDIIVVYDKADNFRSCTPVDAYIDLTAPDNLEMRYDGSSITSGSYDYSSFDMSKLTFTCSDPVHNGVTSGLSSNTVNGVAPTSLTKPGSAGTYTYTQVCTDGAGNQNSKSYTITLTSGGGSGGSCSSPTPEFLCSPTINGGTSFQGDTMGVSYSLDSYVEAFGHRYHCDNLGRMVEKVTDFNCKHSVRYGCNSTYVDANILTNLTEATANVWVSTYIPNQCRYSMVTVGDTGEIAKTRDIDTGWCHKKCKKNSSGDTITCEDENSSVYFKYIKKKNSDGTYNVQRIGCSSWNTLAQLAKNMLGNTEANKTYVACSWNDVDYPNSRPCHGAGGY